MFFSQPHRSTETVIVEVWEDIHFNTERRTAFVLLDFSAAFDTLHHNILVDRVENWMGLSDTVQNWSESYLKDRDYFASLEIMCLRAHNVYYDYVKQQQHRFK